MSDPSDHRASGRLEPLLISGAVIVVLLPFVWRVRATTGGLEFPLDDPYIYLQYARNLARGYLFHYWPGDGYTAGCTSPLYPLLLTPGFWLGGVDTDLITYAWLLNGALVTLCVGLAARLGRSLVDQPEAGAGWGQPWSAGGRGALCAAGFLLGCGGWLWGAMSGLEIALFTALTLLGAWLLTHDEPATDSLGLRPIAPLLWIDATLLTLARPEGLAVAAALVACVLLRRSGPVRPSVRWAWPLCFLPYVVLAVINRTFAGQLVPNTAVYKSVLYAPRQSLSHVVGHMVNHLVTLGEGLVRPLEGGLFLLPLGPAALLLGGGWLMFRIPRELMHRRSLAATFLGLAIAASSGAALVARGPGQFYRYHHLGVALLAVCAGCGLAAVFRRLRRSFAGRGMRLLEAALLCLVLLISVVQWDRWSRLNARAAGEIHAQQVRLARWIDANLPPDAYVLLNDAGAMAFLGHRRTFDLVGLTTNRQARVYLEGTGAVFERLERLEPAQRPTHFAIYPDWLDMPMLMGRELARADVPAPIAAGGPRAVVVEADWRTLGTGTWPRSTGMGEILDALDVADLEDEASHGYLLRVPEAGRGERGGTLFYVQPAGGELIADGGREVAGEESFEVLLPGADRATLRVRLQPSRPARLRVQVDGAFAGEIDVPAHPGFVEVDLPVALSVGTGGRHRVEVRPADGTRYRVFHYWLLANPR